MKRNANTVTVTAIDTAWTFTPATAALNGHVFDAGYSVAKNGDVYILAKVEGVAVRIHVGKASPVYHEALEAAVTANKPAAEPAKPVETKPAEPAKPVETKAAEPAKQAKPATKRKAPAKAAAKPTAKAAKPAKQAKPKAEAKPAEPAKPVAKAEAKPVEPAKPVAVADTAWIGTVIEGKGWRIAFDEAAQRTRVIFAADPSAKQKAAIDAAGFYWSNTTKSWNKKLTRKAYRAALALAETLNAIK